MSRVHPGSGEIKIKTDSDIDRDSKREGFPEK